MFGMTNLRRRCCCVDGCYYVAECCACNECNFPPDGLVLLIPCSAMPSLPSYFSIFDECWHVDPDSTPITSVPPNGVIQTPQVFYDSCEECCFGEVSCGNTCGGCPDSYSMTLESFDLSVRMNPFGFPDWTWNASLASPISNIISRGGSNPAQCSWGSILQPCPSPGSFWLGDRTNLSGGSPVLEGICLRDLGLSIQQECNPLEWRLNVNVELRIYSPPGGGSGQTGCSTCLSTYVGGRWSMTFVGPNPNTCPQPGSYGTLDSWAITQIPTDYAETLSISGSVSIA